MTRLSKLFGYGEDAFTLWALRHSMPFILKKLKDKTVPPKCAIFYRPSFGRKGGKKSPEFGEFDAIVASTENIYLIESKWDFLFPSKSDKIIIRKEQVLRHNILSWYITHWNRKYLDNWGNFVKENEENFRQEFNGKPIAHGDRLLVANLEFVLNIMQEYCKNFSGEENVKNVLLFFYNKNINFPPHKIPRDFEFVEIDYSQKILGNYVIIK